MLKYVPGLALVFVISVLAFSMQSLTAVNGKAVVSAVAIALIIGIAVRNLYHLPEKFFPGSGYAVKSFLRVGVALMGAQLSLGQVLKTGASSVLIVAICVTLAILVVRFISRRMGMSDRLGTLLGVGTSICGVSAIVTTAPVVGAREEETSMAVATITVFGLLAVLSYPLLGLSLGLSDRFFGTWAGTAVNDTSQVVATGLIFSQKAGEIATVVKLTRNLFIAPVILILGGIYLKQTDSGINKEGNRIKIQQAVPLFVIGFILMAVLNSIGVFPEGVRKGIQILSQSLIVAALAGVGLQTNLVSMKKIGLKPFYAGLCASIFMAMISFGLISIIGIQ